MTLETPEEIEKLITYCLAESAEARSHDYDADKAEKTAAAFLEAELRISNYLSKVELNAKLAKNKVERVSAEQFFHYKSTIESKITDASMTHYLARDGEVVSSKQEAAEAESVVKKWNYLLSTLKDGFFYFNSLAKKNKQ